MSEVFNAKLRSIGNSLGLIIPNEIIEEMEYKKGDIIHVAIPNSDTKTRNKKICELAGIYKEKSNFQREKEDRF